MKNNKHDFKQEFSDFMNSERELPAGFDQKILNLMRQKISPSIKNLWPKFVFAQLFAAAITLAVCPQFGIGPLGGGHGLGHLFMRFGEAACAAFCGAFFLASGTVVASLMLKRNERQEVFRFRFRILGAVSVMSFLTLMLIGKSLDLEMLYSGVGPYLAWWFGAFMASLITLSASNMVLGLAKKD